MLTLHKLRHHYTGWIPPRPDRRPKLKIAEHPALKEGAIVKKTDLSVKMPRIWNQSILGACTAFGSLRVFLAMVLRLGLAEFVPSFLAQYYWTRLSEGTQDSDVGASVADAVATLKKMGVATEALWPYDTGAGRFAVAPPSNVAAAAAKEVSTDDYGVDNTDPDQVRMALTAGFAVVFGASVYGEIEDLTSSQPVLPMPRAFERSVGGHCMVVTGHDDDAKLYQVDNSWGPDYALQGRLFLPYDYFHSGELVDDCHVVDGVKVGS